MAEMEFNAEEHQTEDSFEPIPAGWYRAYISASEIKETKSGTGRYLELELNIEDGQFKGRRVWDRLNLWNQNQTAVDISNRQFSQLVRACGMAQIEDSEQIHNIVMMMKLKTTPATDKWDAGNEVKGYKSAEGATRASVTKTAEKPAAKAAATSQDNRMPWQK